MNLPTVLVISADPAFARDLVARWQTERYLPNFTIVGGESFAHSLPVNYELAVVGPPLALMRQALGRLQGNSAPVICVVPEGESVAALASEYSRVLWLRQSETWLEVLILLAGQVLRREEALAQLRRSQENAAALERNAALGRYMLQSRHGFNNALTSLLGNAELLLLECGELPPQARDQINTLHSMALRLHEMMQRFSSLEAEMIFSEKASHYETNGVTGNGVSSR